MPNTVSVTFIECNPAPNLGYKLKWRVAGSGDPYTDEGNFPSSPATFEDAINPEGTCYEVVLQSDCSESGESGSVLGDEVLGNSTCEESGSLYEITLSGGCLPGNPFSNFVITGGVAGDNIKVRASYSGLLQKMGGDFTRADVSIGSPDGTGDIDSSACYPDTSPHGFSISADSDIVVPAGGNTSVVVTALVHNGSDSPTNLVVSIIEINGEPHSEIFATGCKGNSATGGTC